MILEMILGLLETLAILLAMAAGRRIQGGGLNVCAWWPRSTLLGRVVYGLIAGTVAFHLKGEWVIAAVIAVAWTGACCISLFTSIGRDDAIWRGVLRGMVQIAVPAVALIALGAATGAFMTSPVMPAMAAMIGGASGPIYKLGWQWSDATNGRVQATVFGEWWSGIAYGLALFLLLRLGV